MEKKKSQRKIKVTPENIFYIGYNGTVTKEDRATLGSDPSAGVTDGMTPERIVRFVSGVSFFTRRKWIDDRLKNEAGKRNFLHSRKKEYNTKAPISGEISPEDRLTTNRHRRTTHGYQEI